MFRVCLGKHHQFHVVRVAIQHLVVFHQVIDFVFRQGQTHAGVGGYQSRATAAQHIYRSKAFVLDAFKQFASIGQIGHYRFGHAVV